MKNFLISLFLILTTTIVFASSKANIEVSNDIKKLEIQYGGKIGVYTINRNNWTNFSHNETFYFPICSTYRFLVVGAILKKSMTDKNLLNEKIRIIKNQLAGYSPITKKHIDKEMTVNELCKAAILDDNTATNLLIYKLGGLEQLKKFKLSLKDHATKVANLAPGVNKIDLTTNLNKTTPKIMARDINKLAFGHDVLDKRHRLIFKKWLKDSKDTLIAKDASNSWQISDKGGNCDYGTTSDIAIIKPDNQKAIVMSIFYTQSKKSAKPNDKIITEVANIILNKLQIDNTNKNA